MSFDAFSLHISARESAGSYYKLIGILKLDYIYKFKMSCLTHNLIKNKTGNIPDVFSDTLTPDFIVRINKEWN